MTTFAPAPTRGVANSGVHRPIPLGRLTHVEWRKLTNTRSGRWMIAVTAAATSLLMIVPPLAPGTFDPKLDTYLSWSSVALTILLPIVAILAVTTEWSQRTVLATFTQEPRRGRVTAAKAQAVALLTAAGVVFATVCAVLSLAAAGVLGRDVSWHVSPALVLGVLLAVVANMAFGFGLGQLLQNTPAAIVMLFVVPFVFGLLSTVLKDVGNWIDFSRTTAWLTDGDFAGHVPFMIVSSLLWVALPVVAGVVRTARREVN